MIQFNLLPDIKQQYLKAQRQKHMVVFVSTMASAISIGIFVILFLVVQVWQRQSINDLNGDIKTYSKQLESTDDLDKILTVQNQLKSLTGLHDQKAVSSRTFGYLTQLTPQKATITKLELDFKANTISISGSADGLSTVNAYVDTLKFTKYTADDDTKQTGNAFNSVVLSAFGRTATDTTYTITAKFDQAIFSQQQEVTLTVPKITSTRSVTEQPSDLFRATQTTNGSNQ
jgi:Tfp pilus assembly protein PilN